MVKAATSTLTPTKTNAPLPPSVDTVGVFKAGLWYLRLSNTTGFDDLAVYFGATSGDLPVTGDWDGNGYDTIGLYRSSEGRFLLSDSNTTPAVNYTFAFGNPGDTPLSGHWDAQTTGDGVGVFRNTNGITYLKRTKATGFDDYYMVFGNPGDAGIAGDWDNDGFDTIGIYRSGSGDWFLSNLNGNGVTFSDLNFTWVADNNPVVIGDWNGDGVSTVGYLTATGNFVLHPSLTGGGTDTVFAYGPVGSLPVAGKWTTFAKPPRQVIAQPANPRNLNENDSGNTD